MFDFINKIFSTEPNTKLNELIRSGAFLVDVRTPQEYIDTKIAGAVNIPLDKLHLNLDKFKGKENIVVFCRSGNRSGQAKTILNQNGFQNVTNGGSYSEIKEAMNQITDVKV